MQPNPKPISQIPLRMSPAVQTGRTSADFWDVSHGSFAGQQLPPDHEFNELVQVHSAGTDSGKQAMGWILALLIVGLSGYIAYEIAVNDHNPVDDVVAMVGGLWGEPTLDEPVVHRRPIAHKTPAAAPTAPTSESSEAVSPVAGNPYWALPNKLLGKKTELARTWTADEEETWRAGLAHKYTYQRWKTVMDVRERKLKGSDAILWDAMQDKKFWTRLYAAVGLAEMNVEVSLQSLEGALANARSELVADFFERFMRRPNPGQAFILRQVVRLLDEKGRLVVLQGIARSKDELRDLYIVAATQDPGKKVQRWAQNLVARKPPAHSDELLKIVNGAADGNYLVSHVKNRAQATPADKAPALTTEEDIENELATLDKEPGDVEFYEEGTVPANEAIKEIPDADTFEYQDE